MLQDHEQQLMLNSHSLTRTKLALLEIGERIESLREEIEIMRSVCSI